METRRLHMGDYVMKLLTAIILTCFTQAYACPLDNNREPTQEYIKVHISQAETIDKTSNNDAMILVNSGWSLPLNIKHSPSYSLSLEFRDAPALINPS